MKFGLATPTQFWNQSWEARHATLEQIDAAGYDHVFMADHVSFRNGAGADGFVEAAGLSQLHPSLGVMISIYLLPLRHPMPVARQLASMALLAPGRMLFGVGVGGEDRHEIEVCGVDPRTRGKRTNESLQILRGVLAGEEVSFEGDHFSIDRARIRPVPKTMPPIIVGGRSDAALERTGRYGDGWVGVWVSARRYREAVAQVATYAEECERSVTHWQHGYQPWIGVDENAGVARTVVAEQMERFYHTPFEKFERYTPFGTPRDVAEQLAPYAEAGCELFNLKVCARDPRDEVGLAGAVREELLRIVAN